MRIEATNKRKWRDKEKTSGHNPVSQGGVPCRARTNQTATA